MKVSSSGIKNGYYLDKYGKYGSSKEDVSIPVEIEDAPKGTICFALILDDADAIPVCGQTFIHWTIADFKGTRLTDNSSLTDKSLIQGVSSLYDLGGESQVKASCYCGMSPPDKDHTYELRVYALAQLTNLKPGFLVKDLYQKMEGHILSMATLRAKYRK